MPLLSAPKESVLPTLRSVERRLLKDPVKAKVYEEEMRKLIETGAVREVTDLIPDSPECWYIPHHLVSHNGKFCLVFNCSYQYQGQSLNQYLLPGPTLGASLLGVLIRFREHPVAVSGDITAMFHQVRLIPEDCPLLRFLWRNLKMDEAPKFLEWQVLPIGTTSSPCCATYALQRHVRQHHLTDETIRFSVERCFYVGNCLQSLPTADEARKLIDRLRNILSGAGFEIRQWACNDPTVLSHLPAQGSRVRPIWSHVRPNFSRVRLTKIPGRTGASSHSRKEKKVSATQKLCGSTKDTPIRLISWSKPIRDSEGRTPPLIGRSPDIPVCMCAR